MRNWKTICAALLVAGLMIDSASAQPPEGRGPREGRPGARRGDQGGPGGRRGDFGRPQFPLMVALDTDKDGEISAKEIENAVKSLKTLDKNGDGKLAADELRPTFPGREGGRRPEGGPQGRGRPTSPEAMVERIMSMDKNGDGKVSKDELPEQMQRMFERGDTDGDGSISKAEAGQIAERMAEMRGGRGRGGDQGRRPEGEFEGRRGRPERPADE